MLFFLSIGVGLLYLAFQNISYRQFVAELKEVRLLWFAIVFLLAFVAHLLRALRWNILLESVGTKPPIQNTFTAVLLGYVANLAIPRMGEVSRCGVLNTTDQVPVNVSLGTVITERALDFLCMLVVFGICMLSQYALLKDILYQFVINPLSLQYNKINVLALALSGIFSIIILALLARFFYLKLKNSPKIKNIIDGLLKGLGSIFAMENKSLFWIYTVAMWLLYFLTNIALFRVLPTTAHLGASAAAFIFVLGCVATLAPVQGGIGVYHILISQGLIMYAISNEHALVFATLTHALGTIILLIMGTFAMLYFFIIKRRLAYDALRNSKP